MEVGVRSGDVEGGSKGELAASGGARESDGGGAAGCGGGVGAGRGASAGRVGGGGAGGFGGAAELLLLRSLLLLLLSLLQCGASTKVDLRVPGGASSTNDKRPSDGRATPCCWPVGPLLCRTDNRPLLTCSAPANLVRSFSRARVLMAQKRPRRRSPAAASGKEV